MKELPYAHLNKGTLLIASPDLDSGLYFRSVILICEHSRSGSFGLIINKSLQATIPEEILPTNNLANPRIKLGCGGPLQPHHMMILHSSKETEEFAIPICDGVYLGGDLPFLQEALSQEDGPYIRLCFGYCSWGPGQLEKEFLSGTWFPHKGEASYVFDSQKDKIWNVLLRSMGGRFASLSTMPEDLNLN